MQRMVSSRFMRISLALHITFLNHNWASASPCSAALCHHFSTCASSRVFSRTRCLPHFVSGFIARAAYECALT